MTFYLTYLQLNGELNDRYYNFTRCVLINVFIYLLLSHYTLLLDRNYSVTVLHQAQAFYNRVIMRRPAAAAVGIITLLYIQTSCVVSTPAVAFDNVKCRCIVYLPRVVAALPQSLRHNECIVVSFPSSIAIWACITADVIIIQRE